MMMWSGAVMEAFPDGGGAVLGEAFFGADHCVGPCGDDDGRVQMVAVLVGHFLEETRLWATRGDIWSVARVCSPCLLMFACVLSIDREGIHQARIEPVNSSWTPQAHSPVP
ncbi:hypothetical protein PAPYR_6019 [Paratrimastix pyriformis]|uniref:Uncharacterized protein n=1 Tax=Paratrimastix pyriformis TaxID=342808 RepID=A0ABQ8UIT6_9EUKA|nr:hypothetical protein PAPYR_6019 [Paratrimastix pyriformis]